MTKIVIGQIIILFLLCSCGPMADCVYKYTYSGKIIFPKSYNYKDLIIELDGLDKAVYEIDDNDKFYQYRIDTINNSGLYLIESYFTGPSYKRLIFSNDEYLRYNIKYKDSILQSGKFYLNKLSTFYVDSLHLTNIKIPDIVIK